MKIIDLALPQAARRRVHYWVAAATTRAASLFSLLHGRFRNEVAQQREDPVSRSILPTNDRILSAGKGPTHFAKTEVEMSSKQPKPPTRQRIKNNHLAEERKGLLELYQARMRKRHGPEVIRERYRKDRIPNSAIYYTAGEDKAEFYRWVTGQLADTSITHRHIIEVLKSDRLPRRRSPDR
jgi:hypothetical protein